MVEDFFDFSGVDDHPDTVHYVIRPYMGLEGKLVPLKKRNYALHIPQEGRCWFCKERKTPLYACASCQCVRYCSKKCQENDRSRHQRICRPASFYDMSKCALIFVSQTPPKKKEQLRAIKIAYELADAEHIHPDQIRINTHIAKKKNDFDTCEGFFNLKIPNLLHFLERGLSPQEVIRNEYFFDFNESKVQNLLAYGGQDLYFPSHHELSVLKYLVRKGHDPDAVFTPSFILRENEGLFLASVGCTFSWLTSNGLSLPAALQECEYSYPEKIKEILQWRAKIIKAVLSGSLIPVLTHIVIEYAIVSYEGNKSNLCPKET